jgi:hypothetical protein
VHVARVVLFTIALLCCVYRASAFFELEVVESDYQPDACGECALLVNEQAVQLRNRQWSLHSTYTRLQAVLYTVAICGGRYWGWPITLGIRLALGSPCPSTISTYILVLMFVLPFSMMVVLNTLVAYRVRSHQTQRTILIAHNVIDNRLTDSR